MFSAIKHLVLEMRMSDKVVNGHRRWYEVSADTVVWMMPTVFLIGLVMFGFMWWDMQNRFMTVGNRVLRNQDSFRQLLDSVNRTQQEAQRIQALLEQSKLAIVTSEKNAAQIQKIVGISSRLLERSKRSQENISHLAETSEKMAEKSSQALGEIQKVGSTAKESVKEAKVKADEIRNIAETTEQRMDRMLADDVQILHTIQAIQKQLNEQGDMLKELKRTQKR